jgi:hypothetical protein
MQGAVIAGLIPILLPLAASRNGHCRYHRSGDGGFQYWRADSAFLGQPGRPLPPSGLYPSDVSIERGVVYISKAIQSVQTAVHRRLPYPAFI